MRGDLLESPGASPSDVGRPKDGQQERPVIEIVPFAPAHARGVIELVLPIQQEEFGIPITLEMQPDLGDIPGFFRYGHGNFWVATDRGEIVGTIGLLDIGEGQAALRKMFVAVSHRGAGVAKALLDTLFAWCRQCGIREVFLGTAPELRAAHRFYEKNGFREIDRAELPTRFPVVVVDTKFYRRPMAPGLRPYRPEDAPALLALFKDTIRRVNSRDYDPGQVAAWASDDIDPSAWARRFEGRFVVVAEGPSGFAELEPDGHIDRFYVAADHQRMGVGRAMLDALVAEARRRGLGRLHVEASITARPFFESRGFATLARQVVECRGAELTNYRMERVLV